MAQLKIQHVDIGTIHPNPWNPNRQDERTYEAERESIRRFGFVDPVTVRPHPDLEGEWQVIDGEHRWRGATEEGLKTIPVVSLGTLSDTDAQRLTIILNETRGEADVALLGKLLATLKTDIDLDELRVGLPYTDVDLSHLLEIGAAEFGDFLPGQPDPDGDGDGGGSAPPGMVEVVLLYSAEQAKKFDRFVGMVGKSWELEGPAEIVLEMATRQAKAL